MITLCKSVNRKFDALNAQWKPVQLIATAIRAWAPLFAALGGKKI